jgi:hypothetical protein
MLHARAIGPANFDNLMERAEKAQVRAYAA